MQMNYRAQGDGEALVGGSHPAVLFGRKVQNVSPLLLLVSGAVLALYAVD